MSARSGPTTLLAFPSTPRPSTPAAVLHRFELWTLLETHAVARAAQAPDRDLRRLRAVVPELNQQVLKPTDPSRWQQLEVRLHRAINDQAGNPLLASVVERLCAELQAVNARPVQRPGTLWLLQCQHREIVCCIEAGQVENAVRHTRAHLNLLRDQFLAVLTAQPLRPRAPQVPC